MTQKHKHLYNERLKENKRGYLVVSVEDVYKEYKRAEKEQETLDYSVFRSILEFMFTRIWHYMITELWIFKPPHNFGEFYIAEQINSNGFYKNWNLTRKKGKLVEDYNLHTNGRRFYIKWNKRLAKVINQLGYRFIAHRGCAEDGTGRRGLAAHIKKCSTDPMVKDFRAHIM